MFKILGADGREYGPVDAGQLRQWVREGRCGGTTQVRPEGAATWTELRSLSEFADEFRVVLPVASAFGAAPPVVSTLAWTIFVVAGISLLLMLVNLGSLLNIPAGSNFRPGTLFYVAWGVAFVSVPARIVTGIGLLRARPWARMLAIVLAAAWALYGGWGMMRMVQSWLQHPGMFPAILTSPMYLISTAWTVVELIFNITTVLILCRSDVQRAFAIRANAAPA